MSISVKFFASLRERVGHSELELDSATVSTVDEVWDRSTESMPMPANVLIAINMDYVEHGASVADGDEVAFFPPVTGG